MSHMWVPSGSQKKALYLLELQLQVTPYMCVLCVYVSASACGAQESVSDLLDLGLEVL